MHTLRIDTVVSLHRWFGQQKTHKLLQHILLMDVRKWTNDKAVLPTRLEILSDLETWGIHAAHNEQQKKIGWNIFFKGRISRKCGDIQMSTYNADKSIDPVPPHYYSSAWLTAGLIKELIYISLNMWQHRNRFLHNTERSVWAELSEQNYVKDWQCLEEADE